MSDHPVNQVDELLGRRVIHYRRTVVWVPVCGELGVPWDDILAYIDEKVSCRYCLQVILKEIEIQLCDRPWDLMRDSLMDQRRTVLHIIRKHS